MKLSNVVRRSSVTICFIDKPDDDEGSSARCPGIDASICFSCGFLVQILMIEVAVITVVVSDMVWL
jgi:hypothetical protein